MARVSPCGQGMETQADTTGLVGLASAILGALRGLLLLREDWQRRKAIGRLRPAGDRRVAKRRVKPAVVDDGWVFVCHDKRNRQLWTPDLRKDDRRRQLVAA